MHDRRVALVCIVVLMGCCSVAAQGLRGAKLRSKQEVKTGCVSGNCQDGEGEFEMDGEKYKGAFKDGLKEGHGLDRLPTGVVYDGEFHAGKRSGYGVYKYATGEVYKGNWANDSPDGQGSILYTTGDGYSGEQECLLIRHGLPGQP